MRINHLFTHRRKLHHLVILLYGVSVALELEIEIRKVVTGRNLVGIELDGLLEVFNGFNVLFALFINQADVQVAFSKKDVFVFFYVEIIIF